MESRIMRATTRFKFMLSSGAVAVAPGAFGGLSARPVVHDGSAATMIDGMTSSKDREAVISTAGYLARARRYFA
jgi:hypothetical protein